MSTIHQNLATKLLMSLKIETHIQVISWTLKSGYLGFWFKHSELLRTLSMNRNPKPT